MVKDSLTDSVSPSFLLALVPKQVLLALFLARAIKTDLGDNSNYQPYPEMKLVLDGLWVSLEG